MSLGEPVSITVPVLSPLTFVRPAILANVSVPFSTVSVTVNAAESTSPTLIALPFAVEKTRLVSSVPLWAAGTVFTGALFTAAIVTVVVAEGLFADPSFTIVVIAREVSVSPAVGFPLLLE
jgi:hypothetical protein